MPTPKTTHQLMAEFLFALGQLVLHLQVPAELTDLALNFHGRQMRLDIATLTPDGGHLQEWLLALDANPLSQRFGERLELPNAGTVQ